MRNTLLWDARLSWLGITFGLFAQPGEAAEATSPSAAGPSRPACRAAENGEFTFDTGVLRGKLRAGGKSLGLSSVVHVPSGTALDRSMGLFSHYRVFTAGKRYGGGAWDWPSTAQLRDDGAVEVHWPAGEDRPFELRAIYRWFDPATLDLETRVTARHALPKFESFLASYFSEPFTNSLVFAHGDAAAVGAPAFRPAQRSFGDWQMFPRDHDAMALIQDGRWKQPPSPVDWVIRPRFAKPLGVRRAPGTGLAAVLMAAPGDCLALATPQEAEGHYSLYLSLFGRDVKTGATAKARARLVIDKGLTDAQVVALYEAYAANLEP